MPLATKDPGSVCTGGWDHYRPEAGWYLHEAGGIHGLAHAARVLVWGNLIAAWLTERGVSVDLEVVRWSATLHDVRRLTDGKDSQHGARCGDWIDAGAANCFGAGTAEQKQLIAYCCAWHVPPDRSAPEMTAELRCLKDADALDRVRLGGLDTRFLRTECARSLVGQAQFLCDTSEAHRCFFTDPWRAVVEAATNMGLWQPRRLRWIEQRSRLHFYNTCG